MRDRSDNASIFFHFSNVKNRVKPQPGTKVKFVREIGEKGPQASRVWLLID
ncbi:MAG: cold-shock protein [Nitrospiraceae bacterium]